MKKYTFERIPKINAIYDEKVVVSRDDICTFESLHAHDYYEIEYVFSGEGVQIINGEVYNVKVGDVIVFDIGDVHTYYSVSGLKIINICFEKNLLKNLETYDFSRKNNNIFSLSVNDIAEFEYFIYLLERELKDKKKRHTEAEINILRLMMILLDRIGCFSRPLEQRWNGLINLITENYKTLTLEEAVKYMAISKNYFCKIFKQYFGVSFLQYLNNLKVQRAKHLLVNTNKSIESICEESGFTQSKYFYKTFKESEGITPLKYRKSMISNKK